MRENILTFDEYNTILSFGSANDLTGNNLSNNLLSQNSNSHYDKANLDRISIMSSKDNPNEFETFNFDSDLRKYRMGKFYGSNNLKHSNINQDNISNSNISISQRSIKSERSRKFGFSFLNKNSFGNNSNPNLNSKTFINNAYDYSSNLNVGLYKGNENSKNASVENLRNLAEVKEEKEKERRTMYEGYDSNYDNTVFIETPKEGKNNLLVEDEDVSN